MTDGTLIQDVIKAVENTSGVPVYHAPSAHAGEKIIYRYVLGDYDGIYESLTLTLKFISKSLERASLLAEAVSAGICTVGDRDVHEKRENALFAVRTEGGGSGYIGRTGHYFISVKFLIKRRVRHTETVVKVTLK